MLRFPTIPRLLSAAAVLLVLVAATPGGAAAQEPVPLTRGDLTRMLEGSTYAPGEVADMVRRACLGFRLTDDDLRRFRQLGATPEVVEALVGCREPSDPEPGGEGDAPEEGDGSEGDVSPAEPTADLVLPDSVTAQVGDTVRIWARVERQGRGVEGVPILLETAGDGNADDRRVAAATSGPDGTIVFPVPAGSTPGRLVLRARGAGASLAGSPRTELIVRPAPSAERTGRRAGGGSGGR